MRTSSYYVYIMTNGPKPAVLYVGITGDLPHRVWQHKNRVSPGFTRRYNLTRLVYYERFVYPDAAIAREKEIKGWRRSKKLTVIEAMNPCWEDLAKTGRTFISRTVTKRASSRTPAFGRPSASAEGGVAAGGGISLEP